VAKRWRYVAEEIDGAVRIGRSDVIPYLADTPRAALDNLTPNLVQVATYYERRARDCRKALAAIHSGEVSRAWEKRR
jgi:hypothetical protein